MSDTRAFTPGSWINRSMSELQSSCLDQSARHTGARVTTVPVLAGGSQVSLPGLKVTSSPDPVELVGGRASFHQRKLCRQVPIRRGCPAVPYQRGDISVSVNIPLWVSTGKEKRAGHPRVPRPSPCAFSSLPTSSVDCGVLGPWEEACAKVRASSAFPNLESHW